VHRSFGILRCEGFKRYLCTCFSRIDSIFGKLVCFDCEWVWVSQLAAPDSMEQKFAALEGDSVDDELAQMKRGMLSGSRSKASLPEGRPYEKVLQPRDAIDEELEVLRRKARE